MKQIIIKSARMENFKRFKEKTIEFGESITSIFGQNYRGKSSIADLFSWVMFNKSSTGNSEGSQFRPRRYDENGVNVDHVDVVGELTLLIDGEEVNIRKCQRQKWVRHKGDDYDSYTGDEMMHEWNDVPVSATEHKKRVAEIISEDVFRMISNPAAFPSMDAKKQREFLLKNVANITDDDVFAIYPEYEPVKAAMGKGTLEELLAKTKKEITAYKDKQKEIPVRIDQESKRVEEVDFSEKEKELEKLNADLAENEKQLENTAGAYEKLNELKAKRAQLIGELGSVENVIRMDKANKRNELFSSYKTAESELHRVNEELRYLDIQLKNNAKDVECINEELKRLRDKYTAKLKETLAEDALICPTCNQELPADKAEQIKAEFEQKKMKALEDINMAGNSANARLGLLRHDTGDLEAKIEKYKQESVKLAENVNKLHDDLSVMDAQQIDFTSDAKWKSVSEQIEALEAEIAGINTADADTMRENLKAERSKIHAAIDEVKQSLALKAVIEKSKATIEALKNEMTQVTQELANREKLESIIEKFNRAKMDMLSERINGKFKVVKWKLFEQQKNGGIAETCVCMVNGSCYGENTTSATERMMAGMDIISTLQEIYQVEAPIFLDDADLYNEWNIPAMNCQLIKLCVSNDEELRVERED